MFDVEISTSMPLFEYNISILRLWVNYVIIHKGINLMYQKPKNQKPKTRKTKEFCSYSSSSVFLVFGFLGLLFF